MQKIFYITIFTFLLMSCRNYTIDIKNEQAGKLSATYQLVIHGEKKIPLDNETAPNPPYMQIYTDAFGIQILSFLNPYRNTIYLYNYAEGTFIRSISYEREGPNGILHPAGYYIKNMDSIYVYNMMMPELVLTDSASRVKQRSSLIPDHSDQNLWTVYYPQYMPCTVIPMMEIDETLALIGYSPFSLKDSLIDDFRFTAFMDMKTFQVTFRHTYPVELYGNNANWDGVEFFTPVYPALSPSGELIYSFPVSHDIYLAKWNTGNYKVAYAGSNTAKTIRSMDQRETRTPNQIILAHYFQYDTYSAILYDTWRKTYYRFMLQHLPNASPQTAVGKKPIVIIMMDEQFNYLGETLIGTGEEWNWTNSFVTAEGLNIEYIDEEDENEDYLNFKIFKIKEL
ncbi:MAG: DUF4221 domain-containing protein [Tannerella sp.]|jgi:hypothetical protein|nr:DUF4221 domain-containing protein [Tannerella sp.]